jgi:hypothetical protein
MIEALTKEEHAMKHTPSRPIIIHGTGTAICDFIDHIKAFNVDKEKGTVSIYLPSEDTFKEVKNKLNAHDELMEFVRKVCISVTYDQLDICQEESEQLIEKYGDK